ncbi:MAG TPA: c-type cytochrome [Thiolapillus brandeum]|uniref:C-type cytochrome n=1 Tax=Thiolapillus brandeum TaxID=1076588 RepID=A0A831WBI4_9GAMM|nr:c-type cytochrome [Thiolapillus brandeum]
MNQPYKGEITMKKHPVIVLSVFTGILTLSGVAGAGDAAAGKAVYDGKGACASCHGATGAGDGAAAAALNPKPASFAAGAFRLDTDGDGKTGTDADIGNVIRNGAAKFGGNAAMPARADFSDDEVASLVAYIHSLKK